MLPVIVLLELLSRWVVESIPTNEYKVEFI